MSQYAEVVDFFRFGIPPHARGNLTDTQINAALESASATMDSYFRGRYPLPFTAWGDELRKYCCWIAAFELTSGTKGYNPAAGADPLLERRFLVATEWLNAVQRQAAHPDVTFADPVPSTSHDQPTVITSSVLYPQVSGQTGRTRGW